jgi:hypothetical protein
LMILASATGPTNRLVPVSRIASQPSTQEIVVSTPTVMLKIKHENPRIVSNQFNIYIFNIGLW